VDQRSNATGVYRTWSRPGSLPRSPDRQGGGPAQGVGGPSRFSLRRPQELKMNERRLIVGLLSPPPTFSPTQKATRAHKELATARAAKSSVQRHLARRDGHLDQIAFYRLIHTHNARYDHWSNTGGSTLPELVNHLLWKLGARRGLGITQLVVAATLVGSSARQAEMRDVPCPVPDRR
jgi:hypothetical protein